MQSVNDEYLEATDEYLKAWEKYGSDPLVWRQYLFAEAAHRDYLLNLKAVREEGLKEERENLIRQLREEGIYTDEQIAKLFDTPVELIQGIHP